MWVGGRGGRGSPSLRGKNDERSLLLVAIRAEGPLPFGLAHEYAGHPADAQARVPHDVDAAEIESNSPRYSIGRRI
jgi:hypothetical protein